MRNFSVEVWWELQQQHFLSKSNKCNCFDKENSLNDHPEAGSVILEYVVEIIIIRSLFGSWQHAFALNIKIWK